MTHRCAFCLQDLSWETGSYQYVRSMILLHLGRCATYGARSLTAAERVAEATRAADALFVLPDANHRGSTRTNADDTARRSRSR